MNKIYKVQIGEEVKLNTNYSDNNHITLVGKVTSEKKFSHEIYGEKFYIFSLSIPRLSGNADDIPITISERLLTESDLPVGSKISVEGQFRSYNSYQGEKNRLILTVFAKEIVFMENQDEEIAVGKDITTNEVIFVKNQFIERHHLVEKLQIFY